MTAENRPGRGLFVSLEGPEGGGKSTHLEHLAGRLRAAGHAPLITREPGGTAVGEGIRALLLDPAGGPLRPATEALLFCAARAELVTQVIRPALAAGQVVLCDRFADSTRAYQGYGRNLDRAQLEAMIRLATGGLEPDLVLLLDLPVAMGLDRRQREGEWNRLDAAGLAFHERVRTGFLSLAAADPARWRVIDASQPVATVAQAVWAAVAPELPGPGRAVP
jgi:dTMP kinase